MDETSNHMQQNIINRKIAEPPKINKVSILGPSYSQLFLSLSPSPAVLGRRDPRSEKLRSPAHSYVSELGGNPPGPVKFSDD